jgi:site-specific recombinase XerD
MHIQKLSTIQDSSILLSRYDSDDYKYRLQLYQNWLAQERLAWYAPNLEHYRDFLLNNYLGRDNKPLHPNSARAHLSTIRGRYKRLLSQNSFREALFEATEPDMPFSERKAFVDELIKRLENAIAPDNSKVNISKKQDRVEREQLRLTQQQARELMNSPDSTTLMGLRDRALICLMLCTGVREAELCALDVLDLHQRAEGALVLHVRHGKGRKERVIPYGSLEWVLKIVYRWLTHAGIEHGAVFRGFYKGGKRLRRNRLTVRAVNQILDKYPISAGQQRLYPRPHDLRRTYARRLYEAGLDIVAIRDNLGHADTRTTLRYIGAMDIEKRQPPSIY